MFNERLNNLSKGIRTNCDSIKQLKDNTRDLEESLTVNKDLVEEESNKLKSQFRVVENKIRKKSRIKKAVKNSRRLFEEKKPKILKKMKMKHGKTQATN